MIRYLVIFILVVVTACSGLKESKAPVESSTVGESETDTLETVADDIWFEGTWTQALDKAEKESKLIFLDAYTSWCRPCKMMDLNEFTDEEFREFFGRHYVNVKVDMEKGIGITLAQKYNVNGYPSILIIDQKGKVIDRLMGYQSAGLLVRFGKKYLKE